MHVFPAGEVALSASGYSLAMWNAADLWRSEYKQAVAGLLFFAEDAFGEQFALSEQGVYRFTPETGSAEVIAADLEQWAQLLLAEAEMETGSGLMTAWRQQHGALLPTQRLAPKVPFVLGGEYEVANFYAADALERMRFCADLWKQCRDLPAGTKLRVVLE